MSGLSKMVSRVADMMAFGGRDMLLHDIVATERAKGFQIVRPGEAEWFPRSDWRKNSICSVSGNRVRIVLIEAHHQKSGALVRLIAALQERELVPVVVEPHPRLAQRLAAWGWKNRRHGAGDLAETIWYPRP